LRLMPPTRRRIMFFVSIDKAKFRKPARPGDTLEYHVDKVAQRRNMWWYRGEAKIHVFVCAVLPTPHAARHRQAQVLRGAVI
jgi:3-hydroxyacyl-[acyl-carrier-protein] dehydratase